MVLIDTLSVASLYLLHRLACLIFISNACVHTNKTLADALVFLIKVNIASHIIVLKLEDLGYLFFFWFKIIIVLQM